MNTAVVNKASVLSLLKANEPQLRAYGIQRMGLFGSFARDHAIHKKSDVDFLVDFKKGEKTFRNLMNLGYFLEDLLGRKVELVTTESLSPYIGPRILKEVQDVIV